MSKNLANYRRVYSKGALLETEIPSNPMDLFQDWFRDLERSEKSIEINAMTIATIGKDGFPKSRVVLLKEFNQEGFIFYTNYNSEKGIALKHNPKICLSFFWHEMERQVIIKGIAERSSEEKAIEYFNSRPRGSQIGAWASNQSSAIPSREVLDKNVMELLSKYENLQIPKPEYWGGYLVRPVSFEFWQGRPNRLHDRILYESENYVKWKFKRLAP